MASYVILVNFTDQGIRNVKESPQRVQAVKRLVEGAGGKVTQALWTIGPYDLVVTLEALSDEALSSILLTIGSMGNARTTSLRAFTEAEFQGVLDNMPSVS